MRPSTSTQLMFVGARPRREAAQSGRQDCPQGAMSRARRLRQVRQTLMACKLSMPQHLEVLEWPASKKDHGGSRSA